MESRLDYQQIAPGALQAMRALETYVRQSGLERSLLHLIKTRASQINGCAYCLEMHTREARADGESEERLYLLDAWRESPAYSERERAALTWTEAVTLVADSHIPDEVYRSAIHSSARKNWWTGRGGSLTRSPIRDESPPLLADLDPHRRSGNGRPVRSPMVCLVGR
jgi:AhpD family alkylhydroperoxidase